MCYYLFSLILGMIPLIRAEEPEYLQALRSYSSLITSGAGHITVYSVWDEFGLQKMAEAQRLAIQAGAEERYIVHPVDAHLQFFVAFKGDKFRWEIVDTTQNPPGKLYIIDQRGVIVNGKSKAVQYDRRLGEITQGIGYLNDPDPCHFAMVSDLYPSFLKVKGESLIDLLQGRSEKWGQLSVQELGSMMLNGLSCERFRLSNDHVVIDVWLSKEHGYLPKRIEVVEKGVSWGPGRDKGGTDKTVYLYTYKLYGDNIWFVDRIDEKLFWIVNGREEPFSHRTTKIEDDFRINIDLPDDIFQIEFYKGQEVRVWQGRTYKVIRWGQE